jgi:hypothetical protein
MGILSEKLTMKKISLLSLSLIATTYPAAQAIEIQVVDVDQTVIGTTKADENPYPLAKREWLVFTKSLEAVIPHNGINARLSIPLISHHRTKIKVTTDNPTAVYLDNSASTLAINNPGQSIYIRFNVLYPVKGHISLHDENNNLLAKIPYTVTKERPYRQNLRVAAYEDQNKNSSSAENTRYSVNYTMTEKLRSPSAPYWSFSGQFNSDSTGESKSANASFSYTW